MQRILDVFLFCNFASILLLLSSLTPPPPPPPPLFPYPLSTTLAEVFYSCLNVIFNPCKRDFYFFRCSFPFFVFFLFSLSFVSFFSSLSNVFLSNLFSFQRLIDFYVFMMALQRRFIPLL